MSNQKILNKFYKHSQTRDGLRPECADCFGIWRKKDYEENKEKYKNRYNEWKNNNREKHLSYQREYNKINHKRKTYFSWSKNGIKFLDFNHFEMIYDYYINLDCCDFCSKPFKSTRDRQLEHIHLEITNNIRGVACLLCNQQLKAIDNKKNKVLLEIHRYSFK